MAQPADSEQTQANLYNGRCFRACPCHRDRHNSRGYGGFVALRLLHFADLHLDRSFASQRLYGVGAQRRREDLRNALQRIVERAHEAEAELITCGGDLFEHDHVTRDTAAFVVQTPGAATGSPIRVARSRWDGTKSGDIVSHWRRSTTTARSGSSSRTSTSGGSPRRKSTSPG